MFFCARISANLNVLLAEIIAFKLYLHSGNVFALIGYSMDWFHHVCINWTFEYYLFNILTDEMFLLVNAAPFKAEIQWNRENQNNWQYLYDSIRFAAG